MARICHVLMAVDDPFPIGGIELKAGDLAAVLVQDEQALLQVNRTGIQPVAARREVRLVAGQPVELDPTSESYFQALQATTRELIYQRQNDRPGTAAELARELESLFRA